MSAVFVQIGQCGNQVGASFWDECLSGFGAANQKARSKDALSLQLAGRLNDKLPLLLIDSEAKAVRSALADSKNLKRVVRESNVVLDRPGRGGNWALGYQGGMDGGTPNRLLDQAMDSYRKELERCDHFSGTVVMHSLAGGTAAGFGSRFIEEIRSESPLAFILSVAVAPHVSGDSPLQHYNALLATSWLQRFVDGVVLFQNDVVLEEVEKLAQKGAPKGAGKGQMSSPSLQAMNHYIGECLANGLMPTDKSFIAHGGEPWELIKSSCPLPQLKFLTPSHFSSARATWEQLIAQLLHSRSMIPHGLPAGAPKPRTSSAVAVARGNRTNMDNFARHISATFQSRTAKAFNFVGWNPFPLDLWMSTEKELNDRKSLSAFCNSSTVTHYLSSVREKAAQMLKHSAYLHWYERYGCDREEFQGALDTCDSILANYRQFCDT